LRGEGHMKKGVIIGIILVAIVLVAIITLLIINHNKKMEASANPQNEISNEILNEEENVESNEVNEEENLQNTENQNVTSNNQEAQNTVPNASTETLEEEPKTAEEKAIKIVKKDWGEDSSVKISIDGMDSAGRYVVAVRDKETTKALAFYTVNISDGTFTKREMV